MNKIKKTPKQLQEEFIAKNGVTKCAEFAPFFAKDRNSRVSKAYSDDRYEIKPAFLDIEFIDKENNYSFKLSPSDYRARNTHTVKYSYYNKKMKRIYHILERTVKERIADNTWVVVTNENK